MTPRLLTQIGMVLTSCLLLSAAPAYSSVATSDIRVIKGEAVQIGNINDWDFGLHGSLAVTNTALRVRDNTCVFSSTGAYSLQVSSQNGGTRLRLLNTAGDRLRYTIRVRYRDGNQFRNTRLRNSISTMNALTSSQTPDCSDQGARNWNLRFIPTVGRNAFNRASPGVYTDLVTIMITPE